MKNLKAPSLAQRKGTIELYAAFLTDNLTPSLADRTVKGTCIRCESMSLLFIKLTLIFLKPYLQLDSHRLHDSLMENQNILNLHGL
jgi:hypothetical protein